MEEISSQTLITAPALICHLFPRCWKNCLTEFFYFELVSQNVSGDFQKLLPLVMHWSGIWSFFEGDVPPWRQGGSKGQGWHPATSSDIIPVALVPEESCSQGQNGNYLYCLEFVSFKERSDLLFGFFPWSLFGRLCLEKPGKPGRRRKNCLASITACPVIPASRLLPKALLLKRQPEMEWKGKDT